MDAELRSLGCREALDDALELTRELREAFIEPENSSGGGVVMMLSVEEV